MPFTPSHAVVALPFVRTPLLPAGIAVGAMTPDLPLFLRGTPVTYQLTHTNVIVSGLLALVLLALWYGVLRPAVRELTPEWLARRLPPLWDATGAAAWESVRASRPGARHEVWREPGVFGLRVAVSLVLGVISHIVWDAFTHEDRWGVRLLPVLGEPWGPLLGYKWLQYGSGVLGLAVLGVFAVRWVARRRSVTVTRVLPSFVRRAWWPSLPVALVVAWTVGLIALGPLSGEFTAAHLAYRVLPPACAVWGVLTVALCVLVLFARRRAGSR